MQSITIRFWLPFAALLLGTTVGGYQVHAAGQRDIERLQARVDNLSLAPVAGTGVEPGAAPAQLELRRTLDALDARLASLEGRLTRSSVAPVAAQEAAVLPGSPERGDSPGASDAQRAELTDLVARLSAAGWDPSGAAQDFEAFLALAREGTLLAEAIAELEARVDTDPDDLEARMTLADLYVGKLMTVSGPEQGLWGGKAEAQWKQTVARDDTQHAAHVALGTNYSYYPSVMDKTDEAIQHLTRAMELSQFEAPSPAHVQTYLFLSRMHEREGQLAQARSVLELGLSRHPHEPSLEAALAGLPD